jgi:hypothetical protein
LKITGGNAEGVENRGVEENATRKSMKGNRLEIDVEKEGADSPRRHGNIERTSVEEKQ